MITSSAQAAQALEQWAGGPPQWLVQACGRANVIGEHTDYNDGLVMPGAIDRFLFFAARPNGRSALRIQALDLNEQVEVSLSEPLQRQSHNWINYCLGIAQQFQQLGHKLPGLDIAFGGNLPIGAGVSSSAALETGLATLWNAVLDAGLSPPALAQLSQRSSHQFVGIPCGIMDQFASLMGRKDQLILLDCRSLDYQYIPADTGAYTWVLLNTRVHHALADSAYPVRVQECRAGAATLQRHFPAVSSLRDATPEQLEACRSELNPVVFRRCAYVISELERTRQAADYLRAGELERLGQLLFSTHEGLSRDYEVSCPELDFLVNYAAGYPGVLGSRLMGGGFGGCTISLDDRNLANGFAADALEAYRSALAIEGENLIFSFSDGARLLPA
jgi:galactokinase